MVRMRTRGDGSIAEIPEPCPRGCDARMRPGWAACPTCGWGMRYWLCAACGTRVDDPDHAHGNRDPVS